MTVDPTSDLGEDADEENAPRCATCGEPIANEPTHRVVTWIEDGETRIEHFCNEECRSEWDST